MPQEMKILAMDEHISKNGVFIHEEACFIFLDGKVGKTLQMGFQGALCISIHVTQRKKPRFVQ